MINQNRRGVSLIECLLALALAIPLFYTIWSSYVISRKAEKSAVARGSALRGAVVLESYLRKDVASINPAKGIDAALMSSTVLMLTLQNAKPIEPVAGSLGASAATPYPGILTKEKKIIYRLEALATKTSTTAYCIRRNGKILKNVLVTKFEAKIESGTKGGVFSKWLRVEFKCIDPGLARDKKGKFYGYETTLILPLQLGCNSSSFIDYKINHTVPTVFVDGWVEGIDDKYIHLGAFNPEDPAKLPKLYLKVDNTSFPLVFFDDPKNHLENSGSQPYLTMAFDYNVALRIIGGQSYRNRSFPLTISVKDPETGSIRPFFKADFYPSPATDFIPGEVQILRTTYRANPTAPGLDVWLSNESKPGRAYVRVHYLSSSGPASTIARNISNGLFKAFLKNFPENGKLNSIEIRGDD